MSDAEQNDPNDYDDIARRLFGDTPPVPEPARRPAKLPEKSRLEGDPLAEAFAAHAMASLMVTMVLSSSGTDVIKKQLEDLALDASARFRGRVLSGEVSL